MRVEVNYAPNSIEITIPLEPVAKGRPLFGKGRTYTPAKTEKATKEIAFIISSVLKNSKNAPTFDPKDPLGLEVLYVFKRPKSYKKSSHREWKTTKPDKDNLDKLLMDAITKSGLWNDDNQVVQTSSKKLVGATGENPFFKFRVFLLSEYTEQIKEIA